MHAPTLIRGARVLTLASGETPRRGREMAELGFLPEGDVLIADGVITAVGENLVAPPGATVIDAAGRVLMPGFVDCHTHACFAGDRLDEWDQKRAGVPYLEILARGGGIMSTVRAVRAATQEQLTENLLGRLRRMLALGTTTVEVKSGYGLSTEDELKMLRAIRSAAGRFPGTIVPTALLGHAIDADAPSPAEFVDRTITETLPAVSREFPGIPIDAYCEQGAWSLEDTLRLFDRAQELGHPIRVHADQFNSLGILRENILRAQRPEDAHRCFRTIDHLEASTPQDLALLGGTPTIGVVLPCAGFHTDGRYARARQLIDASPTPGAVALATNDNPGSAPCLSMPMAIALAVRFNGLTPAEAITAATVNAAAACGLTDRGVIAPGKRADLILLRHRDERLLAYEFGDNPVELVICAGRQAAATMRA